MAAHFNILAWSSLWIEDPGGLQFMGCKESDTTERPTHTHTHTHTEPRDSQADKSEFSIL